MSAPTRRAELVRVRCSEVRRARTADLLDDLLPTGWSVERNGDWLVVYVHVIEGIEGQDEPDAAMAARVRDRLTTRDDTELADAAAAGLVAADFEDFLADLAVPDASPPSPEALSAQVAALTRYCRYLLRRDGADPETARTVED